MFQGEPFEEEDYCEAIEAVQQSMNQYNPSFLGFSGMIPILEFNLSLLALAGTLNCVL